jgi:bacillithiol biosynthesis cysteine-adding enzyme BshC
MEIKRLPIPESNSLFETYLKDFDRVKDFYHYNFESNWDAIIQKRQSEKFDRTKIAEILAHQNKEWNAPQPVFDNISKLNTNNSFLIITGQQAGVFTGPLYTIYKILTAIKLAEWLGNKYSDFNFIPCFWLEVDDHDFKEINHIGFFNKSNELRQLELAEETDDLLKPIHERQINSELSNWRSIIKEEFYETEFLDNVLEKFFEKYATNRAYSDAFAMLISDLFGQYGLVVLNPTDPEVKKLGQPIYKKIIENPPQIQKIFDERNELLNQLKFQPQIQLLQNQTLLFFKDNKKQRIRVDFDENGDFLLKYNDRDESVETSKLNDIIETTPQQISPNVALRPVIQDYILPTISYVGGPAEIAYFAQIGAIYDYLNQTMPVIYPRHRITVVENKIQKILEKQQIEVADLFKHRSQFLEIYIQQKQNKKVFNEIESIQTEINQKVDRLEKIISEADPTLINTIQKAGQKINSNIEQIIHKLTNSIEQKEAVEINQIKRTLLHLFPEDNFQERVINIIYLLIKYGPDLANNIYERLPIDSKEHHILYL